MPAPKTPTRAEVRLALVHLIELAESFERAPAPPKQPRALRTLTRVVDALTAHRHRQMEARRRVASVALMDRVALIYAAFQKDGSRFQLRMRLTRALRAFGPVPCGDETRALDLLTRKLTLAEISATGGAKQCAADRVALLLKLEALRTMQYRANERDRAKRIFLPKPGKGGKPAVVLTPPLGFDVASAATRTALLAYVARALQAGAGFRAGTKAR
jgi:hypothetical protein